MKDAAVYVWHCDREGRYSMYSDGAKNTIGSVTTEQYPSPFFDQNKAMVGEHQVFSDYLNLFLFDFKGQWHDVPSL